MAHGSTVSEAARGGGGTRGAPEAHQRQPKPRRNQKKEESSTSWTRPLSPAFTIRHASQVIKTWQNKTENKNDNQSIKICIDIENTDAVASLQWR